VLLWVFTTWFDGLFTNSMWPILGFIFLPTSLLWYTVVLHWFGGVWSLWTIVWSRHRVHHRRVAGA